MTKMKSHSGSAKRFKSTGSGKLMRRKATLNHMLGKKSSRRKRALTGEFELSPADSPRIRRMLGK
jgi:large subunit ribosomal protein L35